ncbi:MAG: DUF4910 domain-containing protein [Patescibacteria group bacterium]
MQELLEKLFPICRSITGGGVRQTLNILKEYIPLKVHEVPTGTEVFDWMIPKEWNIRDAYIKNSKGKKIIDFKESNLHVLGYSTPINKKMSLAELKDHIFTLPEQPELIPYLTSYYKEDWGFCMSHEQFEKLKEDTYEVVIDSSLKDGYLSYGEFYIKGKSEDEVLFSSYLCHPSMCNDSISGVILLAFLAKKLKDLDLNYSYRFLFVPETIGAITWLSRNEKNVSKIKHGLVATCVGDSGDFTYKKSRMGNAEIDKIVENILKHSENGYKVIDFEPVGSDERQYCSPGFNLAVGSLMRTMYGEFSEYHTSADNLDFVKGEYLEDSLEQYLAIVKVLENNKTYLNLSSKCEPQLGKRGIYRSLAPKGRKKEGYAEEEAVLWVLNMSDGTRSLLDISTRSGIDFKRLQKATEVLIKNGLLKLVS